MPYRIFVAQNEHVAARNELVFSMVSVETDCYRPLHTRRLRDMLNKVFHKHQQTSPSWSGRLDFDYAREQECYVEEKKVICDRCQYVSHMYNLYEELKTGKCLVIHSLVRAMSVRYF